MTAQTPHQRQDIFLKRYKDFDSLPCIQMATELVELALGDCTDMRILDLGGGSGAQARQALKLGAKVVDVVDTSQELVMAGLSTEIKAGRSGVINYYLADVTKPLVHRDLEEASYDIVMANWLFEHIPTLEGLNGVWRNLSAYAKPGASFIGKRVANLEAKCLDGRYGVLMRDLKSIPDGVSFETDLATDPPSSHGATIMNISLSGSTELHEKYGFEDVHYVDAGQTKLAKSDSNFWKLYIEDPDFVCVTAIKQA